jgi:hypothetical protein
VFVVVLAVLIQLRYSYQAGTNDHFVLSLQGLQWGRPGWLVDDWFVASAPQPHILFDLVTWAGAAGGRLAEVYLAWWLLGLLAGGAATAVLATAWAPSRPVLASAAVAGLLGLSPEVALGSTTPALPTALPHQLGGFLAYLTGALLLTRRPRLAALACVATTVVHVQIGALIAVVCLLAFAVTAVRERTWWWWTLAGVVVSGALVVTVLKLRPVASDGDDFVQICREVIPYHCDASTWPAGQLISGFAVLVAALLTLPLAVRAGRWQAWLWAAAVLTPAVGLAVSVLANRYGVPVLSRLAQSTNSFRLAVLLVPFAAWGLLAGLARLSWPWLSAWLLVAVPVGYGWLVPKEGFTALPQGRRWYLAVLALAVAAVLLRAAVRRSAWPALVAAGLCAAVLITGSAQLKQLQWRPVNLTFVSQAPLRAMGRTIAAHVPPGEVVLSQPAFSWIRLTAGRSMVVDCKAVPYGGPAWREYRARLEAVGGRGACERGGRPFTLLTTASLLATAQRYGARYLLLGAADQREFEVLSAGWRVLARPDPAAANLWLLAAPSAPDAATPG